jgi:hypothetical protein
MPNDSFPGTNAVGNAIDYARFYSRSYDAVIRVCDAAGDVIEPRCASAIQIVRPLESIAVASPNSNRLCDRATFAQQTPTEGERYLLDR